jgi:signal transduction histidine kinase
MLSRQLVLLAALALLTLFAVGWISDHSTRVMARAVDSVQGTRDVLLAVDHFRAALAEAERSARGYVITGLPALRTDFERAEGTLRDSLVQLKVVVAKDPHPPTLLTLESLTHERIRILRELIALTEQESRSATINQNVIRGTATSRRIGDFLRLVQSQELRHLQEQTSAARVAEDYALYGPWVMVAIAAAMVAVLIAQVSTALRRSAEMAEHLRGAVLREQALRERAQEADRTKDLFLAMVSHELRTPLTSILGWCGLIRDNDLDRALIDEGIRNIGEAARVQSHLIEDLLDISRIIAGRMSLSIAHVDPAEVVDKAIASVGPTARAKGVGIRKLAGGAAPAISADPVRVEQILWNLLSNAIKFSASGSSIDIRLAPTDSRLRIEVIDRGEGIAPELLPHIFDRFRQGEASGERKAGLGLGLAIVKNLVELHGGAVRAASDGPGTGAKFTVDLPLAPRPDQTSPVRPLVMETSAP